MSKNSQQTHVQENAELAIPDLDAPPSDLPAHCSAARMFAGFPASVRFTNKQLHNIRNQEKTPDGQPWIPAPINGKRDTCATLGGLLARYEHKLNSLRAESSFDRLTFDSMEICEARTGIPRHLLSTAKEHGCPAFEGSRIRLAPLLRWVFTQAASGEITDWTAHSEKFKALNEEVKYRESIDELVNKAEITAVVQEFAAICFGGLKRLRLEGPREFELRDKAYLKQALEAKCAAILHQAEAKLEQLSTPAAPAATGETATGK